MWVNKRLQDADDVWAIVIKTKSYELNKLKNKIRTCLSHFGYNIGQIYTFWFGFSFALDSFPMQCAPAGQYNVRSLAYLRHTCTMALVAYKACFFVEQVRTRWRSAGPKRDNCIPTAPYPLHWQICMLYILTIAIDISKRRRAYRHGTDQTGVYGA